MRSFDLNELKSNQMADLFNSTIEKGEKTQKKMQEYVEAGEKRKFFVVLFYHIGWREG